MNDDPRLLSEELLEGMRISNTGPYFDSRIDMLADDISARIERIAALQSENGELREAIEKAKSAAREGRHRIENWMKGIRSVESNKPSILATFIAASELDFVEVLRALDACPALAKQEQGNE